MARADEILLTLLQSRAHEHYIKRLQITLRPLPVHPDTDGHQLPRRKLCTAKPCRMTADSETMTAGVDLAAFGLAPDEPKLGLRLLELRQATSAL
jgi:hypothetical protein